MSSFQGQAKQEEPEILGISTGLTTFSESLEGAAFQLIP